MADLKIGFLFLAAGASSRMRGSDKLLEKINGVPLIQRILNEALKLNFPVFVTVPANDTDRKVIISKTNAIAIEVQCPDLGMGHSIAQGLIEITKTTALSSLAICPSDLPGLKIQSLNKLISYFLKRPEMICRPVKNGHLLTGHPVIFPKRYFQQLKLIHGDKGANTVIQRNRKFLNNFETDDESYFKDLDTPEDFANWENYKS